MGFIPWRTIERRLLAMRVIWISTTRPDGRPHAAPVWFGWGDRVLVFASGRATQKARNLAAQPWVAAHGGDGDDAIILHGNATIVTERVELERWDALYREKYVDPGSGAQATLLNEGDNVYLVRVAHMMAWEYGTVGNRTDWRFEA